MITLKKIVMPTLDDIKKRACVATSGRIGKFQTKYGFFCPGINKETLSIKSILYREINKELCEYLNLIKPQYRNNKNFYEITFTNSFTNEKQVEQLVFDDKLESVTVKDGVLYYTFKQKETDEVKIL